MSTSLHTRVPTPLKLPKVQNDITLSVNLGKGVGLTLLDLSVAFDTIDHSILSDCLHDWFGVDGTVLLYTIPSVKPFPN